MKFDSTMLNSVKLQLRNCKPVRSFSRYNSTSTASGSGIRPFKVLGIQQIAIGGTSKQALSNLWTKIFGVEKISSFQSVKENVDEDILQVGVHPYQVEIDLMQPLDETKSPKVHIPPLNHIGLWIDNLAAAVTWLEGEKVRFTPGGIRKGAAGFDVTFIHPKGNEQFPLSGEGVLIELVQAPPELISAFQRLSNSR
jgi:lactoylglutathione lyase